MHKAENCPACHRQVSDDVLKKYQMVCPECGFHHRLDAAQRIEQIADAGSFKEFSAELCSKNPIELDGYAEKLRQNQKQSSMNEAVVTGICTIEGLEAVLAVMSFDFMGGSMGSVVGEKITQAMFQGALSDSPVIIFTASAAALLEQTGVPLFIVLTHPTTGGVTASFAMLGDVIIAEPGALIGFAGPRVIEGTIGQKLPEGFQKSEFQLKKGFVDAIVPRDKLRTQLSFLMRTHAGVKHEQNA